MYPGNEKKNGIGFEVNTGGWRRYQNEQFPRKEILEMLYNAGVRKVTIGSDCHKVEEFGYYIKEGLEVLKKSGFKRVCTFTGRQPEYHKIQ